MQKRIGADCPVPAILWFPCFQANMCAPGEKEKEGPSLSTHPQLRGCMTMTEAALLKTCFPWQQVLGLPTGRDERTCISFPFKP